MESGICTMGTGACTEGGGNSWWRGVTPCFIALGDTKLSDVTAYVYFHCNPPREDNAPGSVWKPPW